MFPENQYDWEVFEKVVYTNTLNSKETMPPLQIADILKIMKNMSTVVPTQKRAKFSLRDIVVLRDSDDTEYVVEDIVIDDQRVLYTLRETGDTDVNEDFNVVTDVLEIFLISNEEEYPF